MEQRESKPMRTEGKVEQSDHTSHSRTLLFTQNQSVRDAIPVKFIHLQMNCLVFLQHKIINYDFDSWE